MNRKRFAIITALILSIFCFAGCGGSMITGNGKISPIHGMSFSNGIVVVTFTSIPSGARIVNLYDNKTLGIAPVQVWYKVNIKDGDISHHKGVVAHWSDGRTAKIEKLTFDVNGAKPRMTTILLQTSYNLAAPSPDIIAPKPAIVATKPAAAGYNKQSGIFIGKMELKLDNFQGLNSSNSSGIEFHLLQAIGDPKDGKVKKHVLVTDESGLFYLENVPLNSFFKIGKVFIPNLGSFRRDDDFTGYFLSFSEMQRALIVSIRFTITKSGKTSQKFLSKGHNEAKELFLKKYKNSEWAPLLNELKRTNVSLRKFYK